MLSNNDLTLYQPLSCCRLTNLLSVQLHVTDALPEPLAVVVGLKSLRRLLSAVQLARAEYQLLDQLSFDLLFIVHPSTNPFWLGHPRVWQAIGQLPQLGKPSSQTSQ
jgi:hypothetical protein